MVSITLPYEEIMLVNCVIPILTFLAYQSANQSRSVIARMITKADSSEWLLYIRKYRIRTRISIPR